MRVMCWMGQCIANIEYWRINTMAAKFLFPMSFEAFLATLTDDGKKSLQKAFGTDDVAFVYSCLRMGWMNKQHHKEKQMRDRLLIEKYKEFEKADNEVKARKDEQRKREKV